MLLYSRHFHHSQHQGFTLIEVIMVILIIGLVSAGIANFLRSSTQIYVDVTERERLLSEGRFAVERINRDLRYALPNSIRLAGNSSIHCLEYTPIEWSGFYIDAPVAPETPTQTFDVVELRGASAGNFNVYDTSIANNHFVSIYPTATSFVYSPPVGVDTNPAPGFEHFTGRRLGLNAVSAPVSDIVTLTMDTNVLFSEDSPISRFYIVSDPISYCVDAVNNRLTRHTGYGFLVNQSVSSGDIGTGVLMAQNVANSPLSSNAITADQSNNTDPFRIFDASLSRNAVVNTILRFELGGELVEFNNEVHIRNVP